VLEGDFTTHRSLNLVVMFGVPSPGDASIGSACGRRADERLVRVRPGSNLDTDHPQLLSRITPLQTCSLITYVSLRVP
jgi:hypothetical protein